MTNFLANRITHDLNVRGKDRRRQKSDDAVQYCIIIVL